MEDFELCEKAQANLERGIYGEGVLNPVKENGVLFYQGRVRESVYKQFESEKKVVGQEEQALDVGHKEVEGGRVVTVN